MRDDLASRLENLGAVVLDLTQPHRCAQTGARGFGGAAAVCASCEKNETSGCDLREQEGHAFGWSESSTRYERLGKFKPSTMTRLDTVRA